MNTDEIKARAEAAKVDIESGQAEDWEYFYYGHAKYLLGEVERLNDEWKQALELANTNAKLFDDAIARAEKAEAKKPTLSEARRLAIQWEGRAKQAERERDMAREDIPHDCETCLLDDECYCLRDIQNGKCKNWKWCGEKCPAWKYRGLERSK